MASPPWTHAQGVSGVSGLDGKGRGSRGRFACGVGEDFGLAEGDPDRARWGVTVRVGRYFEGFEACAQEFPGSRFSVPKNAYQNELLVREAQVINIGGGPQVVEGVIHQLHRLRHGPVRQELNLGQPESLEGFPR